MRPITLLSLLLPPLLSLLLSSPSSTRATCAPYSLNATTGQFCPTPSPSSPSCSGKPCVRGVCVCDSSTIGTTCNTPSTQWLKLGSVAVTQAGMDLAPLKYYAQLNEAYTNAKSAAMTNTAYQKCTSNDGNGNSYIVKMSNITADMYSRTDLIPSSVSFQIVSGGILATAQAQISIINIKLDLLGSASSFSPCGDDCSVGLACIKVCQASNWKADGTGDHVNFNFLVTVSSLVQVFYSSTVQGVDINIPSESTTITFDTDTLGATIACSQTTTQAWYRAAAASAMQSHATELGPMLKPVLITQLTATVLAKAQQYQGVQTFSPMAGFFLDYRVTDVIVTAGENIVLSLEGLVRYQVFHNATTNSNCYINVTYADNSADRLAEPSTTYPVSKTLQFSTPAPSPLVAAYVASARMTRSFFNAAAWGFYTDYERRTASFTYAAAGGISASASAVWTPPSFLIPSSTTSDGISVMRATVDLQSARTSCAPTKVGDVFDFTATGITADFTLTFANTPQASVTFQVVPGKFSIASAMRVSDQFQPSFFPTHSPVPPYLTSALVGGLNFNADQLDAFFLEKGQGVITLTGDAAAIFPNATVLVNSLTSSPSPTTPYTDPNAIDGTSGFIEMNYMCSCTGYVLTGAIPEGTVDACTSAMASASYCDDPGRRRSLRMDEESPNNNNNLRHHQTRSASQSHPRTLQEIDEEVKRALSGATEQQEADLQDLLGQYILACVTTSPTHSPTFPSPTKQPTPAPTRAPVVPTRPTPAPIAYACDPTSSEDAARDCSYILDVKFFACKTGYEEIVSCRRENSDIYCCKIPSGGAGRRDGGFHLAGFLLAAVLLARMY